MFEVCCGAAIVTRGCFQTATLFTENKLYSFAKVVTLRTLFIHGGLGLVVKIAVDGAPYDSGTELPTVKIREANSR